jgi:hypothetical protein
MADERKAKRRLSNLDFSQKKCHVALVDHGAIEHDETLVLKRKDKPAPAENVNKKKEDNMSLDENKAQEEEILKAKAATDLKIENLEKAKADAEAKVEEVEKAKAELEAEKAELEKAKAEQAIQLEEVEKARKERVRTEMVAKSKELKADDAETFATVLVKCKDLLEEEEYTELVKQLEKLQNIEENTELLKNKGEGGDDGEKLDKSALILKRRAELIKEGARPTVASKQARLEIEANLKLEASK